MLAALGFSSVSYEVIWGVLLSLLALAVIVGWMADFILSQLGFGLFGNSFFAFAGSLLSLVLFLRYPVAWLQTDVFTTSAVCIGGAFLAILSVGLLRRVAG
jgi:uncharacterized membrane protein YeaQ/YmgE (transglycosylase-associated protein family)